ncbi:hypothetical protein GCM10022223_37690 [Kineosporia mesophila]|uniref:Uncharacterized protein n=1 Tax=Kineosporia mesophila TaxID=566012 RepID=A0ABP6ZSA3_9ACTN|nr:hypothetical protein [Kineosporia mesophila]MCD5349807.1 hypothetical protein [Kineosporia mesophila]
MHASLYNFELMKLQHHEARALAADERYVSVAKRARRRTKRAPWTKATTARVGSVR